MNFNRKMKQNDDQLIEKIVSLMQRDESSDAPAAAISAAKNLFRSRAAEPKASLLKRMIAVLQIDLQPDRLVFGERSASASGTRQMLFEAGETAVDLRVSAIEKGGFDLRGQILGEDFAGCRISIGEFETKADALSEFKFSDLPKGRYQLILRSESAEIIIENLEL